MELPLDQVCLLYTSRSAAALVTSHALLVSEVENADELLAQMPEDPQCADIVSRAGAKDQDLSVLSFGASDTVRCTRAVQLRTSHSREFQGSLRYNSPDCPVSQRSNDSLRANDCFVR